MPLEKKGRRGIKLKVERQRGGKSTGPLRSGYKMETGTEATAAVVTLHFTEREAVCVKEKGD